MLDLTADRFDRVDFTEATVLFEPSWILPETVEFQVWGLTLLACPDDPAWPSVPAPADAAVAGDLYVAGLAILRFAMVRGGRFEASLYDPDCPGEFARSCRGNTITLTRSWREDETKGALVRYSMDCGLAWPRAACHLELYTGGPVSLELPAERYISVGEYVRNPARYHWRPESGHKE